MRPKERIPIILKLIDIGKLLRDITSFKFDGEIDKLEYTICKNLKKIKRYWESNPQLRFTEVLVIMGYIPATKGIPYREDSKILEKQGVDPLDFYIWTCRVDEDGELLDAPVNRLCKDLSSKHIKNILKSKYFLIGATYETIFKRILKERGDL